MERRDKAQVEMQCDNEQETGLRNPERRKAVKTLIGGASALAAYHVLPDRWSSPVIRHIGLPAHAQTSPTPTPACVHPAQSTWRIDSITTDDDWYGTVFQAQWEPHPNRRDQCIVEITISGTDIIVDIQGWFSRLVPAVPFATWGRNVCTGAIDPDTGLVTITSIGLVQAHPGASNYRPAYYVPAAGFAFDFPCEANSLDVSYSARHASDDEGPFNNAYTWTRI